MHEEVAEDVKGSLTALEVKFTGVHRFELPLPMMSENTAIPWQTQLEWCTEPLAIQAATALLYSVLALPAPTPTSLDSPPTEMSMGGRNSEQVAKACSLTRVVSQPCEVELLVS